MSIILKLFKKIEVEGTLPTFFYKASITLISKSYKDTTRKKNLQANIPGEYRWKNQKRYLQRLQQTMD